MTNEGYILKNFFPKRFLSWGLKTLFASTGSGDGRQPSSVRRLGSTGEISARRPVLLCTACGRLIHLISKSHSKSFVPPAPDFGFYLHKEFRDRKMWFYLHKESRAVETGFYLHKELLSKNQMMQSKIFRAARASLLRISEEDK